MCRVEGHRGDQEVFLVSRTVEEGRRTRRNTAAIVFGVEYTGRLFTVAAPVVAGMGSLMPSHVGLSVLGAVTDVIVVLDATVVRGVLVPTVMQVVGGANRWTSTLRRRPTPARRSTAAGTG